MLATICDDTWNMLNMQHITQIRKDGTLQTLPVVAIKRLKDLPTWLKVAITLEKAPTPTHLIIEIFYKIFNLFCAPHLIIGRQNIQYVHKKNKLIITSEWMIKFNCIF